MNRRAALQCISGQWTSAGDSDDNVCGRRRRHSLYAANLDLLKPIRIRLTTNSRLCNRQLAGFVSTFSQ